MRPLGARAPGEPAGRKLLDTMPTTSRFRASGLVTLVGISAGTRLPDVAANLTSVPIAPSGDPYPRATASPSVRRTSEAASEPGIRPATRVGRALEPRSRGRETSSPPGAAVGVRTPRGGETAVNVPFMPI